MDITRHRKRVQDCDFINTYSVASIKAIRGRGSVIENVKYEDITF